MSIEAQILRVSQEAQALLDDLYRATPKPADDSPLSQAGLREGDSIIRDYLEHGEAGVAFEHLIYMITETGLRLSEESRRELMEIGQALGIPYSVSS